MIARHIPSNPPTYADRKIREAENAGDVAKVEYWLKIKADVAGWPPLTDDEKVKLRAIFSAPRAARRTA